MGKCMGMIVLSMIVSLPTFATEWNDANCTNRRGVVIEGAGGKLCYSTNWQINFWSAKAWCQKHGGKLASYEYACGLSNPRSGGCLNFNPPFNYDFWFEDVGDTDGTNFGYSSLDGRTHQWARTRNNGPRALCE